MNPEPRYILNNANSPIYLFRDKLGSEKIMTVHSQRNDPIFIDLFEPTTDGACQTVKVRAYLPEGQILDCYVVGFLIDILHKDSMFDGKFNTVPTKFDLQSSHDGVS